MTMWNPGQKRETTEASEILFPSEKEFWLMCGEFRDWYTERNKRGYYGLCSCSTESICPPGKKPCQDQFYQLAYCMTKDVLQTAPSVVLIEDIAHSVIWEDRKILLKQLALDNGGAFFEEHSKLKSSYAFMFSEIPTSFFNKIYWWMAEHTYKGDIYAQYSILEKTELTFSSISEMKEKTVLNVLMDDVHPVLILQLAPSGSIEQVTDILASSCKHEGWTLSVK